MIKWYCIKFFVANSRKAIIFVCAICSCSLNNVFLLFLQNFLLLDEISQHDPQLPLNDGKMIVHVEDFSAFWDKVTDAPLQDRDC